MSDPSTDSVQCKLWIDPVFRAAVDAGRGTKTRPMYIIEMAAKGMELVDYQPRRRGNPKRTPVEETPREEVPLRKPRKSTGNNS